MVAIVLERMAEARNQEREGRLSAIEEARREDEVWELHSHSLESALVEEGERFYWRLEAVGVSNAVGASGVNFAAYEYEPGDPPDPTDYPPTTYPPEQVRGTDHHNPEEVPARIGPGQVIYVPASIDPEKAYLTVVGWSATTRRPEDRERERQPRWTVSFLRPVPFY